MQSLPHRLTYRRTAFQSPIGVCNHCVAVFARTVYCPFIDPWMQSLLYAFTIYCTHGPPPCNRRCNQYITPTYIGLSLLQPRSHFLCHVFTQSVHSAFILTSLDATAPTQPHICVCVSVFVEPGAQQNWANPSLWEWV